MVQINGEAHAAAGKTVAACIEEAGYDVRTVAVELDGAILAREAYASTVLADGAVVEIVTFMGGGAPRPWERNLGARAKKRGLL